MTQATVDYAIERLTRNWTDVVAPTEPGDSYKHVDHDPLLDLLQASVRSSLGRTAAGPGGGSDRSPIDIRAFTLMEHIDGIVRAWAHEFNADTTAQIKVLLNLVYDELETRWATNQIAESIYIGLTNGFVRWAEEIWTMFDPPIRKEITAACPECHERYYFTGDSEQQAALIAEAHPGQNDPHVECQRCGARWEDKEQMLMLARSIGANINFDELSVKEPVTSDQPA